MKARQCLAGILTAAMLASLAPSALAAEEPSVPDEEPSVLIQTEVAQADTAAEEHPAPAMVYGPGGINWNLNIIVTCTNDLAAHKGGNSVTMKNNFLRTPGV